MNICFFVLKSHEKKVPYFWSQVLATNIDIYCKLYEDIFNYG